MHVLGKLYIDCPYDLENEPEDVTILEADTGTIQTYDGFEMNDAGNTTCSIRINLTPYVASRVKYFSTLSYDGGYTQYYYCTSYKMYNAEVCELTGILDPFLSFWIFTNASSTDTSPFHKFSFGGDLSRITPTAEENSMDKIKGSSINTMAEPFVPKNEMYYRDAYTNFPALGGQQYQYIMTDILLDSVSPARDVLVNYNTNGDISSYRVEIPDIKTVGTDESSKIKSVIGTTTSGGEQHDVNYTFTLPGMAIYKLDDSATSLGQTEQNKALSDLQALGLGSSIISRWSIPREYVAANTTGNGTLGELGKIDTLATQKTSPEITSTDIKTTTNATKCYNSKALYYFAMVDAESRTGGDDKKFRWIDIMEPGDNTQIHFAVLVNPLPSGRPYLMPVYYKMQDERNRTSKLLIQGSEWVKPSMVLSGKSGAELANYQTKENLNNLARGVWQTAGNVLLGGNFISGAVNMINAQQSAQVQGNQSDINRSVYNPSYLPAESVGLGAIQPNNFHITTQNLNDQDMATFDKFLTKYGWAVNSFTSDDPYQLVYDRGVNFCYIRYSAIDVIPEGPASIAEKELIATRLKQGMRVWKVAGKIKEGEKLFKENNIKDGVNLLA